MKTCRSCRYYNLLQGAHYCKPQGLKCARYLYKPCKFYVDAKPEKPVKKSMEAHLL